MTPEEKKKFLYTVVNTRVNSVTEKNSNNNLELIQIQNLRKKCNFK
jgi:hypothetical protein